MLLYHFRGIGRELLEGLRPAADMAVAALDIEEWSLVEGLDGLATLLFEGDCHDRLDARRWSVIVPGEREDEPLVRDDLAIDTPEPVFPALGGFYHDAVGAADTEIDLCVRAGEIRGAHPALDVLGLRPQSKKH